MKRGQKRCDHCGKWRDEETHSLYLPDNKLTGKDLIAWDGAYICQPCYQKYSGQYWTQWAANKALSVAYTG